MRHSVEMSRKYRPRLPSELVMQDQACDAYREWLEAGSRTARVCLVVGSTGIGKSTMVEMINRMMNYRESIVDELSTRDEIAQAIDAAVSAGRERNLKGRKVILVMKEVDQAYLQQNVPLLSKLAIPLVIIAEEVPWKVTSSAPGLCHTIKCYLDKGKLERRIIAICGRENLPLPGDLKERIQRGEKIGKALSDLSLLRINAEIRSMDALQGQSRVSKVEVLRQLLYTRGYKRKGFNEIHDMVCNNGSTLVSGLLFDNYVQKCLDLSDLFKCADCVSKYDSLSARRDKEGVFHLASYCRSIPVYVQHTMLANDLMVDYVIGKEVAGAPKDPGAIFFNGTSISGKVFAQYVLSTVATLISQAKRDLPAKDRRSLVEKASFLLSNASREALKAFLSPEDFSLLEELPKERAAGKQVEAILAPRFIYKEGHSNYVTRNVTFGELVKRIRR